MREVYLFYDYIEQDINVVRNDTDRKLKLFLGLNMSDVSSAKLYFEKGNTVLNSNCTIENDCIIATLTPTMISELGEHRAQLRCVYNDGKIVKSKIFKINVLKTLVA